MKTLHLAIIAGICTAAAATFFLTISLTTIPSNVHRSAPAGNSLPYMFSSLPTIHPLQCEKYPNTTICHGISMEIDNQNRDYDESPVYDYLDKTVDMDNVTFLYTGSSTPEKDNMNCDTEFPREINVTFGHHPPIILFDGYYKVNETRHFAVRLADGTINSTSLCWAQFTKPKIVEMCDTLCLPPIYTGMKITWLDSNKTAGIVQHQYQTQDYYNAYIAEVRK